MDQRQKIVNVGKWFEADLDNVNQAKAQLKHFPTLHFFIRDGQAVVFGTYALIHDGVEFDRYSLELWLHDNYPFAPPMVFEVGGRIPRTLDRHTYSNGSLCLGVPEDIWPKPGTAINLEEFLNGPVRNYLMANTLVEQEQPWPFGERAHGIPGIVEYYCESFGICDPPKILTLLMYALKPVARGHWDCFCGSGKRMRNCHPDSISKLCQDVRKEVLERTFKTIYDGIVANKG